MGARIQTSAAGALALLTEPEPALQEHAIRALIPLVGQFWAEISEQIPLIETLYESNELSKEARNSAALLASKVYYFLGEYDEALSFALGAGPAFQSESRVHGSEEYTETIVSKAIDRYIEISSSESSSSKVKMDSRLETIIEGILNHCIQEGEHKQALGIALEAQRVDFIQKILSANKDVVLLSYTMDAVMSNTSVSLSYRNKMLNFLLPLFPPLEPKAPHVLSVTRLLVTLSDVKCTVPLLSQLVPKEAALAYQLAFDLAEGGSQDFLESIRTELPAGDENTKEIFDKIREILTGKVSVKYNVEFLRMNNKVDMLILKNTKDALEPRSSVYHQALTFQNAYMHAGTTSDVFLHENLEWLAMASNWAKFTATAALGVIHKGHFEEGMNILGPYLPSDTPALNNSNIQGVQYSEGGALYALGLVNAGCGSGQDVEGYLRDKLRQATDEVVQHGAALGLGVAGMGGRNEQTYDDLKTMLYSDGAVSGEAAGYAMGLVMLGSGNEQVAEDMLTYAHETQHEKIIRGLAIGLAFLFYGRQEQADATIKTLLADKDPILRYGGVYAEALAYAGTANNDAVRKLLHVAVSDTSDDVRRAAVTSLAFLLFKNPAQVPRVVQLLSESYNPHVRCGATLALGIACAGTGLQDAVDILEPLTKDSVEFVRQGAFIALGMVLVQQSETSSPSMASTRELLAKTVASKREDVMARYGAAIGQGLIDAGGRNVTISLQSRAGSRNTNAIVGMALFCQFWYWYPLAHCACLAFEPTAIIGLNGDLKAPKFDFISNAKPSLFAYPPSTKPPTKEAVGKVATAVLSTTAKTKAREKTKEKKVAAEQNGDAKMETDEKHEATEKKDVKEDVEMKIDDASASASDPAGVISPMPDLPETIADGKAASADGKTTERKKSRKKEEPTFEKLSNFSRVTPQQLSYITFSEDGRYQPVRPVSTRAAPRPGKGKAGSGKHPHASGGGFLASADRYGGGGGILLLVDQHPEEPVDLMEFPSREVLLPPFEEQIAVDAPRALRTGRHIALDEDAPEASVPSSFEYPFDDDS